MSSNLVELRLNDQQWRRAAKKLKDAAPFAVARALNRSIVSTRVVMVAKVSDYLEISQGTARDATRIEEAVGSSNKFVARLHARGAAIPLIKFGARGPEPSGGRGSGVTARLQGGRVRFRHAFIARMKSGHRGVFQRATKKAMARMSRGAWTKNLPIFQRTGPSIALVFHKFRDAGLDEGQRSLMKNLKHEIEW